MTKVRFGDPTFLATVAYAPAAERLATVSLDGRVFVLSRNPEMVWQDVSIGHKKYPNARPFEMYAILEEVPEQLSLV